MFNNYWLGQIIFAHNPNFYLTSSGIHEQLLISQPISSPKCWKLSVIALSLTSINRTINLPLISVYIPEQDLFAQCHLHCSPILPTLYCPTNAYEKSFLLLTSFNDDNVRMYASPTFQQSSPLQWRVLWNIFVPMMNLHKVHSITTV